MSEIPISFAHYRYVFDDATLIRWGSPHFSRNEAAKLLRAKLMDANPSAVSTCTLNFSRSQIICANEVFPESAVSDPLSDLELWDEWRSGIRAFPYPGKYSRLGLTHQEAKVSSSTSLGVIGEIFTGLFAQVGIAPWVLVRPIRRWPDFIQIIGEGRYAFVESKAFQSQITRPTSLQSIAPALLGEGLACALQQLNADPFVRVYLSFTNVTSVRPFEGAVVFLELDVDDARRHGLPTRALPEAVVSGLAEQAVIRSGADVYRSTPVARDTGILPGFTAKDKDLTTFRNLLSVSAEEAIEAVLIDHGFEIADSRSLAAIREEVRRLARKAKAPDIDSARRYSSAKQVAAEGKLTAVRAIGDSQVYMADLLRPQRQEIESAWKPNWKLANTRISTVEGVDLWRGSSTALCLSKDK